MGVPVTTVASGGLPVADNTSATLKSGIPVSEAPYGTPVTKVTTGGLPVVYVTSPPLLRADDDQASGNRTRKVARRQA